MSNDSPPMGVRAHVATHELMEMATDPFPLTDPAWNDLTNLSWTSALVGHENADLCEDSAISPDDYPFAIASGWSNRRVAMGLTPCSSVESAFAIGATTTSQLDLSSGSATLTFDVYSSRPEQEFIFGVFGCEAFKIERVAPANPGFDHSGDQVQFTVTLTGKPCDGLEERLRVQPIVVWNDTHPPQATRQISTYVTAF